MRRKNDKSGRREQHSAPPPVVTPETVREQRAAGLLSRITSLPLRPPEPIVTSAPPSPRASSAFVVEPPRRQPAPIGPGHPVEAAPPVAPPRAPDAPITTTSPEPPIAPARRSPTGACADDDAGGGADQLDHDLEATTLRPRHYGLRLPDESVVPLTRRAVVIGRRTDQAAPAATDAQLVALDDPGRSLSRRHVSIVIGTDGAVWVTDLDSGNGTTLVSTSSEITELEAHTPRRVRVGSLLSIGDHAVTIVRRHLEE
jgi:pSer/pThr/pTyr-binding forkhead associated (FHA) protein